MGPQKLATIIGHKYSIFKPSKKIKVFLIIKIRQIILSKKNSKISIFWGHDLETHFCELLRPHAPPFQKIK